MIFYSLPEVLLMVLLAIVIDWVVGDPERLPHPVIYIGKWIKILERTLLTARHQRVNGVLLTVIVTISSFAAIWGICELLRAVHPWLGFAAHTWLISTTIAVKGLKDAAMLVFIPLSQGDIGAARKFVGYIVGRDTAELNESEVSRATVETVAENIVDAFVSPILYAILGAAPLAMFYRASNTLDSMVGYKNDRYIRFGWASARWDDVMNYVPARISLLLITLACWVRRGISARWAWKSAMKFARLHPSPNSGFPESAVAGALGIELGGTNTYGGMISERARMGWPKRPLDMNDIQLTVKILYGVSYFAAGGIVCVLAGMLLSLGSWR